MSDLPTAQRADSRCAAGRPNHDRSIQEKNKENPERKVVPDLFRRRGFPTEKTYQDGAGFSLKEGAALHPLMKDFGVSKALVCTYQAISGAGKTFDRMPEIIDNVIPYIGGEEEKSEREPLKLWGHIEGDHIVNAEKPVITAQCFRVPVSDGHTAAVFVSFDKKPSKEEILKAWAEFRGPAQELDLPSAPKQFLHYFEENDRPQPKLDRNTEHGMAVCIGRLREDTLFDYKFACMSHNTLRGAAGGAVLLAELLAAKGYFD